MISSLAQKSCRTLGDQAAVPVFDLHITQGRRFAAVQNVGFSKIIGVGNRCNVGFADLMEYLVEDETTDVIAMYMEGVDDPHRLMDVARSIRGRKPVVVYKVGRSEVSDKASQFHTGSLAGPAPPRRYNSPGRPAP